MLAAALLSKVRVAKSRLSREERAYIALSLSLEMTEPVSSFEIFGVVRLRHEETKGRAARCNRFFALDRRRTCRLLGAMFVCSERGFSSAPSGIRLPTRFVSGKIVLFYCYFCYYYFIIFYFLETADTAGHCSLGRDGFFFVGRYSCSTTLPMGAFGKVAESRLQWLCQ